MSTNSKHTRLGKIRLKKPLLQAPKTESSQSRRYVDTTGQFDEASRRNIAKSVKNAWRNELTQAAATAAIANVQKNEAGKAVAPDEIREAWKEALMGTHKITGEKVPRTIGEEAANQRAANIRLANKDEDYGTIEWPHVNINKMTEKVKEAVSNIQKEWQASKISKSEANKIEKREQADKDVETLWRRESVTPKHSSLVANYSYKLKDDENETKPELTREEEINNLALEQQQDIGSGIGTNIGYQNKVKDPNVEKTGIFTKIPKTSFNNKGEKVVTEVPVHVTQPKSVQAFYGKKELKEGKEEQDLNPVVTRNIAKKWFTKEAFGQLSGAKVGNIWEKDEKGNSVFEENPGQEEIAEATKRTTDYINKGKNKTRSGKKKPIEGGAFPEPENLKINKPKSMGGQSSPGSGLRVDSGEPKTTRTFFDTIHKGYKSAQEAFDPNRVKLREWVTPKKEIKLEPEPEYYAQGKPKSASKKKVNTKKD